MTQTRYRLTGRLETGELAELYQALRDEKDRVLIKLFHPRTTDQRYARVVADAQLKLQQVEDEAVLRVTDLGTARGRLAVVREFVDGYTLGQALSRLMTREVLMAPTVALYVIIQLLDAVQRAHEVGVLHGAITPGNIMVGKDGRAALADFGALQALQAVPELRSFLGKGRGAYRAPEVATQGEASVASDVYSLGAIAYELLTLKEAARATKTVSTRHEPLPPPSRLDRRINARLDPVVMRALELTPQRRFKSCAEFSAALRNFLSASGGMPSRAELAKVVGDLFPNEVQVQVSPQIPFVEPFALEEVTGVDASALGQAAAPLTLRPSFSGGAIPVVDDEVLSGSETIEAMPAFEPYKAEATFVPAQPMEEPRFDEGTSPGAAGPLEHGWDAPAGPAPKKRVPLGTSPVQASGVNAAMKRVRVMEDFSVRAPDTMEMTAPASLSPEPAPAPAPAKKAPPPPPEVSQPVSTEYPLVKDEGTRRPMITEERALYRAAQKKRRYLLLAAGVALLGLFAFGLVVYRFGPKGGGTQPAQVAQAPRNDEVVAPSGPPPATPLKPPEVEPARGSDTPVRIEAEDVEKPYVSPRRGYAYLTVKASARAKVYVDGKRLGRFTPIVKARVEPGTHTITLEAVKTGEKREVERRFSKGRTVSLYEFFPER